MVSGSATRLVLMLLDESTVNLHSTTNCAHNKGASTMSIMPKSVICVRPIARIHLAQFIRSILLSTWNNGVTNIYEDLNLESIQTVTMYKSKIWTFDFSSYPEIN